MYVSRRVISRIEGKGARQIAMNHCRFEVNAREIVFRSIITPTPQRKDIVNRGAIIEEKKKKKKKEETKRKVDKVTKK